MGVTFYFKIISRDKMVLNLYFCLYIFSNYSLMEPGRNSGGKSF